MDLSIIIVNWNSAALLRKCLQSVMERPPRCEFEIIVIDNGSFDGSDDLVSREFRSVRFVQSDQNLGFAGANNVAFQQSTGRYVLFLNPDTEVLGDALDTLLETCTTRNDAGVVGPRLVNPDLSSQMEAMYAFPTIVNQLLDSAYMRHVLGRFGFAGLKYVINNRQEPVQIQMLPGTCIMLRRDIFSSVGEFNDEYFMYAEDVELNYRVKQRGLTNYYVSAANIIHHGGHSSSQQTQNFFSAVMMREAVWKFFRSNRGPIYAYAYKVTTALVAVFRLTLLFFARILTRSAESRSQVRIATAKWVKILRWSLGLEPWARTYKPAVPEKRPVLVA